MASKLKKHLPLLQALANSNSVIRKKIIKTGDTKLIFAIIECIHNTLIGNVKLSKKEKDLLRPYQNILRRISKSGDTLENKKKLIVQKGGSFLPLILSPILSILYSKLVEK